MSGAQAGQAVRPTIEAVARHAAVSRQTVSNALSAPERLKADTLTRVLSSISELGHRPSQAAARGGSPCRTWASSHRVYRLARAQRSGGRPPPWMDRGRRCASIPYPWTGRPGTGLYRWRRAAPLSAAHLWQFAREAVCYPAFFPGNSAMIAGPGVRLGHQYACAHA
jgi:hypothetical protein